MDGGWEVRGAGAAVSAETPRPCAETVTPDAYRGAGARRQTNAAAHSGNLTTAVVTRVPGGAKTGTSLADGPSERTNS
jgi:hypothetical protein